MIVPAPPSLVFRGESWSGDRVAGMAAAWREALRDALGEAPGPLAMVMANHPESVALFFALSCFPVPVVVLSLDLDPWRCDPPLPRGTRLVLSPRLGYLATEAPGLDVAPIVLADPEALHGTPGEPLAMATPGFVLFTSGSTGLPRPVYRSAASLIRLSTDLMAAIGVARGGGVIATLPLGRAFGLNHALMAATVLGSSLAVLERFDHGAVLRLFASRAYQYWAGTPAMADVLGRCPLSGAHHPAPPLCVIGGRVSADVARRFEDRFQVPLRGIYGTTETGTVSIDAAHAAQVRSDTAGRPLAGIDLRVADDPRQPFPAETPGRIWLSSRYLMDGYGFPPDLDRPGTIDGWWPTPDVGHLDRAGRLSVLGRLDDCFRTAAGHLVNPGAVAAALDTYPGVLDVAGLPLATAGGPVLGLLVESAAPLNVDDLRRHLLRSVPAWSQPRIIETTAALPRLASGRADRRACITRLQRALDGNDAG